MAKRYLGLGGNGIGLVIGCGGRSGTESRTGFVPIWSFSSWSSSAWPSRLPRRDAEALPFAGDHPFCADPPAVLDPSSKANRIPGSRALEADTGRGADLRPPRGSPSRRPRTNSPDATQSLPRQPGDCRTYGPGADSTWGIAIGYRNQPSKPSGHAHEYAPGQSARLRHGGGQV